MQAARKRRQEKRTIPASPQPRRSRVEGSGTGLKRRLSQATLGLSLANSIGRNRRSRSQPKKNGSSIIGRNAAVCGGEDPSDTSELNTILVECA